jgi:hypothetical protein
MRMGGRPREGPNGGGREGVSIWLMMPDKPRRNSWEDEKMGKGWVCRLGTLYGMRQLIG